MHKVRCFWFWVSEDVACMKPIYKQCGDAESSMLCTVRGWFSPRKENQPLTDSLSWEPNAKAAQNQCSPGKLPLHWPTVQLQDICPSEVLKPKQGSAEYSVTGTVGKWCGQAVTNTIAHLLSTERLLQGRTTSQCLVCPGHQSWTQKQPQGVYKGWSMPGTGSGYFQTSSSTENRIPKHQAGGVESVTFL